MIVTVATETKLYLPDEIGGKGKRLPLHPRTLSRYAREGKIGHVLLGGKVYFRDEDIERFIAKHTVPPVAAGSPQPTRNPRYANR